MINKKIIIKEKRGDRNRIKLKINRNRNRNCR